MKPFSPTEAAEAKINTLPEFVVDVVNGLIAMRYSGQPGGYVTMTLKEVKAAIKARMFLIDPDMEFKDEWLDFEPIYRKEGWQVHYDKPGYNESYDGYYEFKAKS